MTDEYKQEFWDLLHVWADAASEESIEHAEHRIDELLTLMASAQAGRAPLRAAGVPLTDAEISELIDRFEHGIPVLRCSCTTCSSDAL